MVGCTPIRHQNKPEKILSEKLPILAWVGPPANLTTIERYTELKEAGFTHNYSRFPNNDAQLEGLDIAHQTGIRLFINTPELKNDPEGTVKRFRNHPAIAGYHLRDEPTADMFADLSRWVKRIRALDDNHFCYINLYPNYASPSKQLKTSTYREHVDRFISEVPVQVLSFDHYPIIGETLRPEWYENLEIIAEASRKAQKPFWAFVLAVAHGPYPIPTIAHLRLQAFSNLAYGAQGIQYFTYWTPLTTSWDFHNGPIDKKGKRTGVYDLVRQMNSEIQAVSGVFNSSRVISVRHTGDTIPKGTKRYYPEYPFLEFNTEGIGALVSNLEKGPDCFLVVVNRDFNNNMMLRVTWDSKTDMNYILKDGSIQHRKRNLFQNDIEPGDAVIFMWKNSTNRKI